MATIRVPSAPQTNLGQQPVTVLQAPRATADSFGAIQARQGAAIGQAVDQSSDVLNQTMLRIRNREDTAARAVEGSTISRELNDDYRARLTGNELTTSAQVQAYGQDLDARVEAAVNGHAGSAESKAQLRLRLMGDRDRLLDEASFAAVEATRATGRADQEARFRPLNSSVVSDPSRLDAAYRQADAIAADYAGLYTPQEDLQIAATQRSQLAASAVEGYMSRGLYDEAADLAQMPGVVEAMTPEQQSNFSQRLLQARERENEQWNGYQQNLRVFASALNTTVDSLPTYARVQAAGMQMPSQQSAQSSAGKMLQDREMFSRQYGADSEQVAAFDALTAGGGEPPSLSDVGGIRKEFTSQSKDFVTVRDAYDRIQSVSEQATPASDMALIFNYMKMLDPGSVVRETEFAMAARAGSFGQRIQAQVENITQGTILQDEMRRDYLAQADNLYGSQLANHERLVDEFGRLAEGQGIAANKVIIDFVGDGTGGAAGAGGAPGGPDQPGPAAAPAVVQYGLDGLPVGGSVEATNAAN